MSLLAFSSFNVLLQGFTSVQRALDYSPPRKQNAGVQAKNEIPSELHRLHTFTGKIACIMSYMMFFIKNPRIGVEWRMLTMIFVCKNLKDEDARFEPALLDIS